jgi:hypothetical protein
LNRPNVDVWLRRMLDRGSIQNLQGLTLETSAGI